ncbi:MAG: hypothetical protein UY63_C0011G0008 [Parcubacteria group bacterium GW2011_GWA2_51_10]|nr:MAG: hypothetical protein UY63_C0011G0008 [Parcubacteria group bacterium GW2011_GWA2_51_10]
MNNMQNWNTAFFLLFLFFVAPLAHAQFLPQSAPNLITVTMRPEHPGPLARIELTAHSSSIDLSRSELRWHANGKLLVSGAGATTAEVVAGPLGSVTSVSVSAQDGAARAEGSAVLRPVELDLLWESDSYTPPFYRGRALPSAGSNIRLQAVARLKRAGGTLIPERDIVYTWRRNGSVVASASGKGKSSATLPAPSLFGADTISVSAASTDGVLEGSSSIRIPSLEPILFLYEDHPIFGVLYNRELSGQSTVAESELTFAAVPYFASTESPDDRNLKWQWRINGREIPADPREPSMLTINADRSFGRAQIDLLLTHATNWFLQSAGSWAITFSPPNAFEEQGSFRDSP